jgi:hypothetical protein
MGIVENAVLKKEKLMITVILVLGAVALTGLFCVYVLPKIWKPKP